MNTPQNENRLDDLDVATSARLARLRAIPVDTTSLERRLRAALPELGQERRMRIDGGARWARPMRAVAASLLAFGLIAAAWIMMSGRPALASAEQMARLHNELVSANAGVMRVESVEAANTMLAGQWSDSPGIPTLPNGHEMACCMKSVQNKKVACLVLKGMGTTPITLTVANAGDMKMPASQMVERGGVTYHVQAVGAINMVMTERQGRWVCLMGETSANSLMDLAERLRF